MLDWIFEGILDWVAKTVTSVMDAVSGLFLNALGTDMTAMEEYFPFVSEAFTVMQYTAWALLFLIVVWQLFKTFGGPLTEGEEPWGLVLKGGLFALLIYFAKPIFLYVLEIARAPYTALMDLTLSKEAFTFAGVENVIKNGLVMYVSNMSVVGALLQIILLIALGWNYFKLLLEVVERYIVVGILCYTSPLAYSMGASKSTSQVFKSWCRMVGSQLLLLVMNVWFLRAFNTSVAQYCVNGGALSNGRGNIFLWLFCAIAFLNIDYDTVLSKLQNYFPSEDDYLDWEVMDWLETLPYYIEEPEFICVHAGIPVTNDHTLISLQNVSEEEFVFNRRFKDPSVYHTGKCVFFGHTQTDCVCGESKILGYQRNHNNSPKAIQDYFKIHLDTGTWSNGVLGCLCIDTMKAIYVTKRKETRA